MAVAARYSSSSPSLISRCQLGPGSGCSEVGFVDGSDAVLTLRVGIRRGRPDAAHAAQSDHTMLAVPIGEESFQNQLADLPGEAPPAGAISQWS